MNRTQIVAISAFSAFVLLGSADHAGSQSIDLGQRMDQISAERARAKANQEARTSTTPAKDERQTVLSRFVAQGSCPAWTDRTYAACDCEASELPDQNARLAWRSACGVMALDRYSGATFEKFAQLECSLKSEFDAQVRQQLAGSAANGSLSYANKAWQRWSNATGCKGSPIPLTDTPNNAEGPAPLCRNGDVATPDTSIPPGRGEIRCPDGAIKSYEIELRKGFIFRIKDSDGRVSIFNASRSKDPENGAFLLNPDFLAGAVCAVQADPSLTQRLNDWLRGYLSADRRDQAGNAPLPVKSTCIGVRG